MNTLRAWLVLFLLCTVSVGAATQDDPPSSPPSPPGLAKAMEFGPSKAFQIRSTQKDSVGFALGAGWNLISLPLEPYDTQIGSVLASISGSYDQVWAYDGCDAVDPWRFYDPADPAASNLTTLDHRLGFWIHMTQDATLTIDGDPPTNTDMPICAGWNLLGYPRNAPLPVTGALVSIADAVDRVFGFVPDTGSPGIGRPWRFWGSTVPDWVNDLDAMVPGHGYWVLANADALFSSVAPEPPPVIGSLDLLEGQEITAPTPISATITTSAEVSWTLALRPEGEGQWIEFAAGDGPNVDAELDPTLLLNGIYEVRLEVFDVFGQSTSADGNVIVDGAMKPGVVTLSYPDMIVPMAGLPITVIRTYDSRFKSQGDFGVGWRLALAKGTYRNNRPPGEGWNITLSETVFNPPCSSAVELLTHFTDIRLGDQGFFRFALAVDAFGYASQVNGGCSGEAHFVQTGGRPGATLHILGNTEVFSGGQTTDLVDASTFELYEPQNVLLTTPEGTEYVLNLDDGVRQITEPNGATVTFADNGVHHSDGRSVFFERDAEGRIRYLIDPAGQTVSYTYDDAGDLVAVTDLLGETTQFEYLAEIPHHLAAILDDEGQISHAFEYDEGGRLAFTCPGGVDCVEMQHDVDNRTEVLYDATGRPSTYTYDEWGNVLTRTDALGQVTTMAYDEYGRMTSITDPLGGVTSYGYDERGNLITTTKPHDPSEPESDYTITRTYDHLNRVTAIDLPTGGGYRFSYAGGDNEAEVLDHEGNLIASYGYDMSGRQVSETGPFGTVQMVLDAQGNAVESTDTFGRQTVMGYDSLNRLTSMVDHQGQTSTFDYDPLGRETRAEYGNGMSFEFDYEGTKGRAWTRAEGPTTGTIHRLLDNRGRIEGWRQANGSEVRMEKDATGRPIREIGPLGQITQFDYDSAGLLVEVTGPRGGTRTMVRDALGRVIESTDELGHTTQTSYYPNGRPSGRVDARGNAWSFASTPTESSTTDPLGREMRVVFSELGLPETWIYADGTESSVEYLLSSPLLDAEELPVLTTDEAGRQRQMAYDNYGRMVTVTDEAGATTTFGYGEEQLVSITGPTGQSQSFTYDNLGNTSTVTQEDGGVIQLFYNDANRVSARLAPSGESWTYNYDEAGRLINRQASTGESVSLTYNASDQILTMHDSTGTTEHTYDSVGSRSRIDFPDGSSVSYDYDLLGRVSSTTVTAPPLAPLTTQYAYDSAGNLESITDPLGGVTTWTFDAANRPIQRSLPNGVTTDWTYDLRDRVLSVTHRDAQAVALASVVYERALTGEPTLITWNDGSRVELGYDDALRLTQESFYDSSGVLEEIITYTYDASGTRTSRSDASGTATYHYDLGYRLSSVSGPSPESYSHDTDGRLTQIIRDGNTLDLGFDAADRLVQIDRDGQALATYIHDGEQRRVSAGGPSGDRRFVVAPVPGTMLESPHLVTDGSGSLAAAYVWSGSQALMRIDPAGTPTYYLTDAMGSVMALADGNGNMTGELRYDGFGNIRSSVGSAVGSGPAGGDFRFQGAWLEEATGLYHLRARDYDPHTGFFLSRDPAAPVLPRPESLHPYRFAEANPYVYRDPTGYFSLINLNLSINSLTDTEQIKAALAQQIWNMGREAVGEMTTEVLFDFFQNLVAGVLGGYEDDINTAEGLGNGSHGNVLEEGIEDFVCSYLGNFATEYLWLEVEVDSGNGRAEDNGYSCGWERESRPASGSREFPNPDFIIGKEAPMAVGEPGVDKSWLIGDFKFDTFRITPSRPQFYSVVHYAQKHVYGQGALYITWRNSNPGSLTAARAQSRSKGVFLFILVIKD